MRKLVVGVLFGFLAAATAAWALEVTFPTRSKAQARVIVDELGNVLFGAMPAKVEVSVLLKAGATTEPWSTSVDAGTGAAAVPVTTVPSDRMLVITDLDGAYGCNDYCELRDGSGSVRFQWLNWPVPQRTYGSGVVFGPGEEVIWAGRVLPGGTGTPSVVRRVTFMGRLIPAS